MSSFETTLTSLCIEKHVPKDINDKLLKVIQCSLRNFFVYSDTQRKCQVDERCKVTKVSATHF